MIARGSGWSGKAFVPQDLNDRVVVWSLPDALFQSTKTLPDHPLPETLNW
jgi:hypothetical protein